MPEHPSPNPSAVAFSVWDDGSTHWSTDDPNEAIEWLVRQLFEGHALIREFREGFSAFDSAFEANGPEYENGTDLAERMDAWLARH